MKLKCHCGNGKKFVMCKCDIQIECYCGICGKWIKCVRIKDIPTYEKQFIIKKRGFK